MKSILILFLASISATALAEAPDTVFLNELTWTEVRDKIESGTNTIIVATAGTEQNGPHLVLGKHEIIVTAAAEQIARRLGNALVSPTINHVPEGGIDPPTGAMRYPGAISLPNVYFMKILEYTARSHEAHGFTNIVFIGDSGGNRRGMEEVAEALNYEWRGGPSRVHFASDYYSNHSVNEWLESQGETPEAIGRHAGIATTSQVLAIAPEHVRLDKRAPGGGFEGSGVTGDPTRANVEYGRKGLELRVEAAVSQIQKLIAEADASR